MKEDETKVIIAAATAAALGLAGLLAWRQLARSNQVKCWSLLPIRAATPQPHRLPGGLNAVSHAMEVSNNYLSKLQTAAAGAVRVGIIGTGWGVKVRLGDCRSAAGQG